MIRVGMAGTGSMAVARVAAFLEMPNVRVSAVWARNIEKAASICHSTGATACGDFGQMLDHVDAVVVCLPNHLHTGVALESLRRKKHVLVEYPLCARREDISVLREAAGTAVLMVGNTIVHEAIFQRLWSQRGRLGGLVSAASRVAFHSPSITGSWYMHPASRGPLFAAFHYHHIEYYRRFLGEVAWVLGRDESQPCADGEAALTLSGGTMLMGHAGGATSCIQWYLSGSGDGVSRGMWMTGTVGTVSVYSGDGCDEFSRFIWDGGGEGKTERVTNHWGVRGSCEDFIGAITGTLDSQTQLQSDLQTLEVAFAADESHRSNRRIELPDQGR